ncbi:MAG: chaperone ClpB [Clostridiales bacterium]|nr:MAG: chaperone ClpB [Clostridiales bacterium]
MTTICCKCKKRPAVVFVQKFDAAGKNPPKAEGYCLLCAKELGIGPVNDMLEKMGIDDDQLEAMGDELSGMMENLGMLPMSDDTPDDTDSNDGTGGNSDGNDGAGDDDDNSETRAPAVNLGSIFGNLGNFGIGRTSGQGSQGSHGKKSDKGRKNLDMFTLNLTEKAKRGQLDRVIGRERELERTIQILCRRQKNNPCLIGEPGVGKTAVAEALAQKIAAGDVPLKLKGCEVCLLDMTAMVAGTQFRGQFENRMKGLIEEVKKLGNIILVIDEVHNIVAAGDAEGGMNAANILKPALSRGEIHVIGATTLSEYRKYIEKDSALERRFQPVVIAEPSVEDTVKILDGIKSYYADFHGIVIPDETVRKAVILSERYITDRFLPDKAIDLLDEASAYLALHNSTVNAAETAKAELDKASADIAKLEAKVPSDDSTPEAEEYYRSLADAKTRHAKYLEEYEKYNNERKNVILTPEHLAEVIEIWTGIPAGTINENEFVRIDKLADRLKKRIVGQDKAVDAVAKAIKRQRSGIYAKEKPVSFIFAGPTGVGKTELVKTLASDLFDSPEALIRLDMSEFMEKHSVSRIIGAPPGYVGYDEAGQLTEKIRRRPYCVVLFDEIEKAHPDVLNILLQILDDGRITDAHGKEINFKNVILVMTTNAGSTGTSAAAGFSKSTAQVNEEKTQKALSSFLRPEFLNRIDEIITFNPLTKENFVDIARIMIKELADALSQKNVTLDCAEDVYGILAEKSFSEKYGARNLRRLIQTEIEDKAAELIISGYDSSISAVSVYSENGEIRVIVKK